jgi:hypothetical protein
MRFWILVLLTASVLSANAKAQTTQPSIEKTTNASDWTSLVNDLKQALTENDAGSFHALVAGAGPIRSFGSSDTHDAAKVMESTSGAAVIGAHAYIYPPLVMAADVAADFKSSEIVTDSEKKKMVPESEEEMRRANATAAQWMRQTLSAQRGDPVAVIIMWRATEISPQGKPLAGESVFMLVRGQESDDSYRITQVIFGNPDPQRSNQP